MKLKANNISDLQSFYGKFPCCFLVTFSSIFISFPLIWFLFVSDYE